MDKTILNMVDGKPAHTGTNPDTADLNEVKSVLGKYLHDSDRPEDEKAWLRAQLHAARDRETLLGLWREITGQQI